MRRGLQHLLTHLAASWAWLSGLANVKFAVACAHLEVADVDDHGEHHHEAVRLVLVKSAAAAPGGFEEMEAPAISSFVIFRVRCVGGGWEGGGRHENRRTHRCCSMRCQGSVLESFWRVASAASRPSLSRRVWFAPRPSSRTSTRALHRTDAMCSACKRAPHDPSPSGSRGSSGQWNRGVLGEQSGQNCQRCRWPSRGTRRFGPSGAGRRR